MSAFAWLTDADSAVALARDTNKPLFLYWGASWCPPCNRSKASAFARADFAQLAQGFVPLHIDGDRPGAQSLGDRFALRSYPTMVLFQPDGTEITRLPCELSGERFVAILKLALSARLTVAQSLSAALSRERPLSDDEWRLLAYYSWDTDETQLLKRLDLAATLAAMRDACTLPDAALRLEWHALHAAAGKGGIDQQAAAAQLQATLADPAALQSQMDIVVNYAVDLVRALAPAQSDARAQLAGAWASALVPIEDDATVNVADRLAALRTRVRMARLGAAFPSMEATVRGRVAAAAASVHDKALRHQVINTAAGALSDAGLLDDAAQLLEEELDSSHAPFYFMHNLAALAKKRGDTGAALDWYERAWNEATGPATRLQWGATCLLALLELAPQDSVRIERVAADLGDQIASGMGNADEAASGRNRTQLRRIGDKLAQWPGRGPHTAALLATVRR